MDQKLLPQITENNSEGDLPAVKPLMWDPQRVGGLAPAAERIFTSRERGDYWRVTILATTPAAAATPRALIGQGVSVSDVACVQLDNAGSVRIPMSENQLTVRNTGSIAVDVIVIAIGNFEDEYIPGVSLL